MPVKVIEYRCLLISPSDVKEEREQIGALVQSWNAQIGHALQTRLELVKWEAHATPELGAEPQKILNNQIVDDCDFGIAVFWSRLGSKTENHESGSVEEIEYLIKKGSRVLIYFSKQPVPQDILDTGQYTRLRKFKSKMQKKGLLGEYIDIPNLKEQLQLHLTSVITGLIEKDKEFVSQIGQQASTDQPRPKIVVKVNNGVVQTYTDGVKDILSIDIQNHSNFPVFLGTVTFLLKDGKQLFVKQDSATGEYQKRKKLMAGQAFSFHVYPEYILEKVSAEEVECVAVSDDIDRIYKSDSKELHNILNMYVNRH